MTHLLLDTHVALWWLADDRRLSAETRAAVEQSEAHISAASTWELAIKVAIGKLTFDFREGESFAGQCMDQGFTLTAVTHEDAWGITELPPSRSDPFDRMIAATALRRGWTVVTADPAFEALGVPLLKP